jgi:hypothetical protein
VKESSQHLLEASSVVDFTMLFPNYLQDCKTAISLFMIMLHYTIIILVFFQENEIKCPTIFLAFKQYPRELDSVDLSIFNDIVRTSDFTNMTILPFH